MDTRTGDLALLAAEFERLADINLDDSDVRQQTGNPWMRFRFAAAHSLVALLALGQASESWYVPMLFVLVSCWDYCVSFASLPHRSLSNAAALSVAAVSTAVVVVATMSLVALFIR